MALPKKQLKEKLQEAGVLETAIDGIVSWILDGHTASVDAVKEQLEAANNSITDLTAKNAAIGELTKERDNLKNEVKTLKESSDKAAEVQKQFDAYKQQIDKRDADAVKNRAITKTLKTAGVKRDELVDLLISKIDLDSVEMDGDNVKDSEKWVAPIKEKYSSLFAETTEKGTPPTTPPTNGSSGVSKEDILKIKDAGERQKAIAENLNLFMK